jgi:nicotinate-nucleotide adenylyltransferase
MPEVLPKIVAVVKAPLLDICATYISQCIQQKKSIRYLVPEPVRLEIEKAGYYLY